MGFWGAMGREESGIWPEDPPYFLGSRAPNGAAGGRRGECAVMETGGEGVPRERE